MVAGTDLDVRGFRQGQFAPGLFFVPTAALAAFVAAAAMPGVELRLFALVTGLTLVAVFALRHVARLLRDGRDRQAEGQLRAMVAHDASPCFTTDSSGVVRHRNLAAEARFGLTADTLAAALGDMFTGPRAVLYRLQLRADAQGWAREDVVTRRGHLRLSVHRVAEGRFLWRLEEFQDRGQAGRGAESLTLPMMTANRPGVILFMNEAMRRLLGGRPRRLDAIFAVPNPRSGEMVQIATAEGPIRAILAEVEGVAERREIYLLPASAPAEDGAMMMGADYETVPVPLLNFAPEGHVLQANRAAREMLELEESSGQMIWDMFEGLGRSVGDWLADVAAERTPGAAEVLNARALGPDVFMQVTLRRMSEGGRPSVLAVLQDATTLKRLEAQLSQSQKMQAIGQLAGGVAHDFNNLLTAISGHCDLLLMRHDSMDGDFSDLDQIRQNANRAAALVGQLLAFSRKQTLKPERLDVQELLSDLAHLLNRLVGEKIRLRLAHAPELGPIRADRRKLEQVVMNLVVNARDAMAEGGTIRIETEEVRLRDPMTRDRVTVPAGEYAVIRVSDTGCGIPADRLEKIFEPFYTTKKQGEGTGLGLAMAYGIVKQSGGYIFVDSVEAEGTVFHLWFPVNDAQEQVTPPLRSKPAEVVLKPGEGVVLLVEDEAPVRAFASRALRMRGYTVIEAQNAEEALTCLQDPNLSVDVFVTDVVMPGMDGPSWVRLALEDRPDTRVIFVSGYAEDALTEMQARIPNSVFLPKPFSLSELAATVQGQLLH